MEFTVKAQGPTLAQLTARSGRALRSANRAAGRDIAKDGVKAMEAAAKGVTWRGRPLRIKIKADSSPTKAQVTFTPAKGLAGAWAIAEKGRRGGYLIKPRAGKALAFGGRFAMSAHPKAVAGKRTWTKATKAIDKAIRPELEDLYEEALSGG